MSVSIRKDLVGHYFLIMSEIMNYGGEGLEIMINRGWMEQPPQSKNRQNFFKT